MNILQNMLLMLFLKSINAHAHLCEFVNHADLKRTRIKIPVIYDHWVFVPTRSAQDYASCVLLLAIVVSLFSFTYHALVGVCARFKLFFILFIADRLLNNAVTTDFASIVCSVWTPRIYRVMKCETHSTSVRKSWQRNCWRVKNQTHGTHMF